jgi:hypothetical protein
MREGVGVGIACGVGQGIAPHVIVGDGMYNMQSVRSHNEKKAMSFFISLSISLSRYLHIYIYMCVYMHICTSLHMCSCVYMYICI